MVGTRVRKMIAAGALVAFLALLPATAANATSGASNPAPNIATSTVTTQRMIPDYADLSSAARSYAAEHNVNVCGLSGSARLPGAVTPLNEVPGDCGSSSMYMGKAGGSTAWISYGFDSSIGDADFRALGVAWSGGATSGNYPDVSAMFDYVYSNSIVVNPGYGNAHAALLGTIETWWGLTCYMKGPTASITI